MLSVKIHRDPYEERKYLFNNSTINLNEGLSVVIGRNGCGKTTFLREIENFCRKQNIPCFKYDNYTDGGSSAQESYLFMDDIMSFGATAFHSEGEQIFYNFGKQVERISAFVKEHKDAKQIVIMLDAIDSGLDIDGIAQLKAVAKLIEDDLKYKEINGYIIVTANNYALVHKSNCLDVRTGEYKYFDRFEDYEDFINTQYKIDREKANRKRKNKNN